MTKLFIVALSFGSLCFAACGSKPDDGSEDSRIESDSLLESCSGQYSCDAAGESLTTTMRKEAGRCYAGQIELRSDGTIFAAGYEGHWTGDRESFQVCMDGDCTACTKSTEQGGREPKPPEAKKCTGSGHSCSSQSPGDCSRVQGCYLGFNYKLDGSSDAVCKGSPNDCRGMSDEKRCKQQGCSWK